MTKCPEENYTVTVAHSTNNNFTYDIFYEMKKFDVQTKENCN